MAQTCFSTLQHPKICRPQGPCAGFFAEIRPLKPHNLQFGLLSA
jgi:hypothetical protein